MKFSFKIQQYQTDAVDAVARVFQGQSYNAGVSYLRDMGNLSAQPQQLSLVSNGDDATQVELLDFPQRKNSDATRNGNDVSYFHRKLGTHSSCSSMSFSVILFLQSRSKLF